MAKDMPSEQKAAVSVPSKPSGSSGSAQKPSAYSQKSGTSVPQKPTSSGLRKPNFNPANMKKSTTGFHLTPELRAESMAMRRAHSIDVYNKNADRFATIEDYINSGNLSIEQTKSFLEEAEGHAQSDYARAKVLTGFDESTGAPIHSDRAWSDEWTELANLLRGAGMKASYQSEIEGLKKSIGDRSTLRQAAQNRVRSATSLATNLGGVDENGNIVEGDKHALTSSYWKNIIKGYDEQDAIDNAKLTALQNEMYEAFKTDEVRNAEAILQSADNDAYATDPSMLVSKEARDLAQMQIDNYNLELGLPTRYVSEIDADRAVVKSGAHGIEGALVGAAGTINKMADQANGEMKLGSETLVFNGTEWVQKTEEDTPKEQRRIGGELVPEAGEIAKKQAIANDTPFNPDSDPIKAQTAKRAQEYLDSRAAVWSRNATNLQAQYDKNAERIAEIEKADRSALDPQAVAELARERDRLKKENKALERDIKDARDIATQYGGGRGSISYYLRTGDREGFAGALDQVSWDLGDKAQEELRKAQEGRDIVTKTAMNMVKTGMEMGFDSVVGAATGVGGLPVMFVRVFGQASQEANRKGASLDRQVLYGLTVAGIEVLTEKIADFAGGAIYGKSFTGDLSKKLIHKLNASPNWETFLYAVADTLGEGAEEGLSDILAGFADMWIEYDKEKGFFQNWKDLGADDRANILYDVLLGSLMGAVGAGGAAITGQYNADLAEQYQADLKRDFEAVDKAAEAKANAPRVSFADSVAQASGPAGTAQTQAVQNALKGHFAEQLENEMPKSAATKTLEKVQAIRDQIANGEEITVKLTRQEAAIAQSMGLLNKEAAKALQEPTERQRAKANAIVEKSTGKTSERRETIIANATKEGVRTQSDTIPEGIRDESDVNSLPPSPEGPQSSREAVAADAAKAKEQKAAIDSGETNNKQLVDVVGEVDTYVGTQNPIATITKDEISDDSGLPLSKKVWNWVKKNFGDKVYSEKLKTDVIINERGIKNDVSHGVGKVKALTFQAVPTIIKNGEVVSRTIEDGKTKSIVVAGKVYLGEKGHTKPVNVYCLLKADDAGQNRFYLHEVSDGKGNLFYQLNNAEAQEESAASALQDSTPNNQGSAEEAPSGESIPQETTKGQEENGGKDADRDTAEKPAEESTAEPKEDSARPAELTNRDVHLKNTFWYEGMVKRLGPDYNKVQNPNKGRDFTTEEKEFLDSISGNHLRDNPGDWIHDVIETGDWVRWYNAKDDYVYWYNGNTLYRGRYGSKELTPYRSGAEALKVIDEKTYLNGTMDAHYPELYPAAFVVSEYSIPDGGEMIDNRGTKESTQQQENGTMLKTREDAAEFIADAAANGTMSKEEAFAVVKEAGFEFDDPDRMWEFYAGIDGAADSLVSEESAADQNQKISANGDQVIAGIVKEVNDEIEEDIRKARARGNKRFDAEGKRQAYIFYGIDGALADGQLTADEAFSAMQKYAPDILRDYGYKSGADMAAKKKTAGEKVNAEIKALAEKFINREKLSLDQIIAKAWERANSSAKFNHELSGRGKEKAGWNYFIGAVKDMHANGEISLEETNAAITKVTGSWGEWALSDIPSMAEQYLAQRQEAVEENKVPAPATQSETQAEGEPIASTIPDQPNRVSELESENEVLRQRIAELEGRQPQEAPAEQRAAPSGTRKQSQNAEQDKTQTRPSINNAEERAKDTAEKFGVSDGTYISLTREKVSQIAKYWLKKYGAKNEYNRLIEAKDWNRIDFSVAGKLVYDMTMKLNRDMTNGSRGLAPTLEWKVGETKEEYRARQKAADDAEYQRRRAEIDALIAAYGEQKSVAGQKLQEQYKYSVADEIRIKASKRFLSYSENGEVHNASEFAKNAKLWNVVDDLLTRMEAAETAGNANEMIELTKMVSRIRSRQNMFGKAGVSAENFMLDRMMKLGLDADKLATIAYGNINKIMDDITPITYADAIESVRMSNMLSNVATGINNLLNNAVSARTGALAQKAAIPFAKAFEKATGRKIAIDDKSLFRTKEIRRAEELAYEYAVLSAYYGINSEDGRLDVRSTGGSFSVMDNGVGGFIERALARYNFFIQAFVLSPDAPVKARVKTGLQQGIDKAFEGADLTNPEVAANKHELEGYAGHEAKRRTLQDDNRYTNAVLYAKKQLLGHAKTPGEHVKLGGRELGSLDLGQFMIAFAKVPANVGIQKVAATPYGSLYHVAKYAITLAKAKADPSSVSTIEMAKASRDVGRAATTWGSIGLGALAAMTGALKNFDDTDDDEEKKLAAEKGYRGLMLNLSTIFRPGDDWRDGDLILNANFLEILATPLSIGALIYDASQEGVTGLRAVKKGTMESFTGMIDAIMEIPGLQQAGELYQAFANRDPNEDDLNSALKALGQFSVNTGTSYFMPNVVSQFNAGLDNKQRDVYGADSYKRTLLNIVMSKTPGLRQLLPEKTDAFGSSRTYADSKFMSIINTVLLPGDIKRYHVSDLEKELMRIKKETGYAGTFVDTKGPRKIEVGEDEYVLNADQRRAFHETKAKHIVAAYDAFRNSEVYKSLTDEQRLAVYKALRMDAERMTKSEALKAAGIEATITMDKWETTLTSWESKATYQAIKQMFTGALDEDTGDIGDFAKMDELIKTQYPKLTKEMQELIANSNALSYVDDVYGASKVGITSEKWQLAHNIYSQWTAKDENGKSINKANIANEVTMWDEIRRAGNFSDNQMDYIEENMKMYYFGSPKTDQYYEYQDAGLSREAATRMIQATSGLEVQPGYTDYIQANQRYVAIAKTAKDAPEAWKAFWAIVPSNASKSKVAKLHKLEASGSDLMSALRAVGYSEIRGRKPNGKGGWTYYTISK